MSGRVPPGAVLAVGPDSYGAGGRRASPAVRQAFDRAGIEPQLVIDGPLSLAWAIAPHRSLAGSDATLCFVDGVIDDGLPNSRPDGPNQPAAALASAYEREGPEVLSSLRGDYWILLWERRTATGLVVTDRMGGGAPYWWSSGGRSFVASELPELLAVLGSRPGPDPVAMAHWLSGGIAPEGRTMFAGISRLEAGCLLDVGPRGTRVRRYWMPVYRSPLRCSRSEAVGLLHGALRTSIDRRVRDARAPGLLLSGGLDSSVLASLGAEQGHSLSTYSATFPNHPLIDESTFVDTTTEKFGLPSTRIAVRSGSVLQGALQYLSAWGVPPTSPNHFFWMPLFDRASADGVDVMLDGEGGDELFGLSPGLLADRLMHLRLVAAARLAASVPGSPRPGAPRRVLRLLWRFGVKGAVPSGVHATVRRRRGPDRYARPWLRDSTRDLWFDTEQEGRWKQLAGPRWWSWLVGAVLLGGGPGLVYEQARRRAAMSGIVARHPLVDGDVIDLVLQLRPEWAYGPSVSRPLLREVVAGTLPEVVRMRPQKSSFDSLFHQILAGRELTAVMELVGTPGAEVGAYVDLAAVQQELLDRPPPGGSASWALQTWRLLTAECWLRAQSDSEFVSRWSARPQNEKADWLLVRSR